MTKNKKQPQLSAKQLENLISISVRNSLDVVSEPTSNGFKFLIVLECLNPEMCIPPDLKPESKEEELDLLEGHGVAELFEFVGYTLSVKIDGKHTRAIETVPINGKNVTEFLQILDNMCNYWDEVLEEEPLNLNGKNVVEGNGTLN